MGRDFMTDRALPAPDAVPATATGNDAAALTPLAPGFRFHPTDEELISYYLKRKVQSKPMSFDLIGEVDVYKLEPSDLPAHSRLKTKDQEWFFFSSLEKKHTRGGHINRATKKGFWKITGQDKEIRRGDDNQLIGMVRSLVFYSGRAPKGLLTNWLIHEYRLVQNDDQGLEIDAYVLCRLFNKQNPGPLISEKIYAPFVEEDWDDDDPVMADPFPSVVHANRINEIQQENHSQSKNLINLDDLFRGFEIDDDPKTVDQDDNDEPLTRECLPLCVLNKEAPFPLSQYKRKRQIDSLGSSNKSSRTTQDHCSSPATTGDTISSVAATVHEIEPEPVATMAPASSSSELINYMQKKNEQEPHATMLPASSSNELQMAVEREKFKLETMEAEVIISFLQGQIDTLREENDKLKKKNSNKGQCS